MDKASAISGCIPIPQVSSLCECISRLEGCSQTLVTSRQNLVVNTGRMKNRSGEEGLGREGKREGEESREKRYGIRSGRKDHLKGVFFFTSVEAVRSKRESTKGVTTL